MPQPDTAPAAERLLAAAITATSRMVAVLPEPLAASAGMIVAAVGLPFRRRARRELRRNLAHAFAASPTEPLVRRTARQAVIRSGSRGADALWSIARPDQAARRVRFEPPHLLDPLLAARRGVVLAGPHAGHFEAAAAVVSALAPAPVAVLADFNLVGRALRQVRTRSGLIVLDVTRDTHAALRLLADGGVVCLLADLHRPGMRGYTVRLLDTYATIPAGPAVLARLAHAPIVPFVVRRLAPRCLVVRLSAPIDPPPRSSGRGGETQATQRLADAFGRIILAAPHEWDAVDPVAWQDGGAA